MPKIIINFGESITVECNADTRKEVIKQAAFFAEMPRSCGICNSEVIFFFRNPRGNEYYGLRCFGSPSHELNFGIHMADKGGDLYFKSSGRWESSFNGNRDDDQGDDSHPTGSDFPVEDARLVSEIEKAWNATSRNMTLENAVMVRFKKPMKDLNISDKRKMLEALQGAAAGA